MPVNLLRGVREWLGHISFEFFTPNFLSSVHAASTSYAHKNVSNQFVIPGNEAKMAFEVWLPASRKFLECLKEYWPKQYPKWKRHYEKNYYGGQITAANWSFYRGYDVELRRNIRPSSGKNPKMTYEKLRTRVSEQVTHDAMVNLEAIAAGRSLPSSYPRQYQNYTPTNPAPGMYKTSATFTTPSNAVVATSSNAVVSAPQAPRNFFQPAHKPEAQMGRLQIEGPPEANPKKKYCFACGRNTHNARTCNETAQINGKPIFIIRIGVKGSWFLPDGTRFCYNYNGYVRCSGCTLGAHVCSRCGEAGHYSEQCP